MKIVCTAKEFGELVRSCECTSCVHCALKNVCGPDNLEEAVTVEIVPEVDA